MRRSAAGIIPARWGSTRFPGKPLHLIAGKPLLRHVWERCCRARTLDAVIIATDDMRIAEAAFAWGAEVSLTSSTHQSGTDRIAEVARKGDFSHVINIQGDEPLTDPKLLDRLVRRMQDDKAIEMITAAHPFEQASDVQSPHQVKVVLDRDSRALYFSRSAIPFVRDADARVQPLRHQGIYGYTRELLMRLVQWKPSPLERAESLEQLRALENGVTVHVLVTKHGSPGVDTPEDAAALEKILAPRARRKTRS
ncbi:MAG: 3-deoxy-manno-octulosonate cytidylyltransferase [Verrucomicrobiota bacterium]|nr:3-deoxy-manno-octulosonate cytidylyltransferase [Verrucomicrobiota bacterium]